jgi:TonB family protein
MKKPQQQRIMISLVLALLIHALLLLVLTPNKQEVAIEFADERPSMSVTLDAVNIAATVVKTDIAIIKKKVKHKNQTRSKVSAKNNLSYRQTIKPGVTNKSERLTRATENTPIKKKFEPTDNNKQKNISAINRAKLLTRLSKEIREQYFIYPIIAQRNNIQGTVLLGFGIKQTGIIHDIHIIKSSGHAILDLAAEQSMKQLHSVNWTKGMFAKTDIALELPIIYKLVE